MTKFRIGVSWDVDYEPDGSDGKPLPESREVYEAGPFMDEGRTVSYEEYCAYRGNPDRHIGAAVLVERLRPEDRDWEEITALHGVDLMDDTPEADVVPVGEYGEVRWYYPDSLPPGYLGEVARELLREAGHVPPA